MKSYLFSQVQFVQSPAGICTSVHVIKNKVRNQRGVIERFRQSIVRSGNEKLLADINYGSYALKSIEEKLEILSVTRVAESNMHIKRKILLLEARAAKIYWSVFGSLAHMPEWSRKKEGHPKDHLNFFLNIGYHQLKIFLDKEITAAHLSPDIGILHSAHKKGSLTFDFMELWRQPLVDICILNLIRRHPDIIQQNPTDFPGLISSKVLHSLKEKRFWYKKKCYLGSFIIQDSISDFKKSLYREAEWIPEKFYWGRGNYCK